MSDTNYVSLPYEINVEMKTYQSRAFPLGIMKANVDDYDTWLCNKLINSYYAPKEVTFDSYEADLWPVREGLAFEQKMLLSPDLFACKGIDLIELIRYMLRDGYYIYGTYNEFYIPGKSCYQKNNNDHDYILFGYDDRAKVFKSAGYLEDNRYAYFDIAYEAYFHSIVWSKADRITLNAHKIDKSYIPQLNIKHIKEKLENYLFSRLEDHGSSEWIYGIDGWDCFDEYMGIASESLDLRYSRLYIEHRGIMCKRIHKLTECSYVSDGAIEERYRSQIYSRAQMVHHMFIKYNLTHNKELFARILQMIREINDQERKIIAELLVQLDSIM